MLSIPFLVLFLVTPAVFWFRGKRFLGDQTHPAALFILTCIASFVLLCFVKWAAGYVGEISLLWVIVNFAVFAAVKKIGQKPKADSAPKETQSEPRT